MPRIPYVNKKNMTQEVNELFSKMESNGANVLNLWKMVAHSPKTLKYLIKLGNTILTETELDPKLREISILRVAEILDCDYEKKAHIIIGQDAGITANQITDIKNWELSSVFGAVEQAVLNFTDEVTRKGKASISIFSELEKHLGHRQIIELTITIGFYGMLARLLLTFEVDLEDDKFSSTSQIIGR